MVLSSARNTEFTDAGVVKTSAISGLSRTTRLPSLYQRAKRFGDALA